MIGVDLRFALVWWHGAKFIDCLVHHHLAIGWKLAYLPEDLASFLFLLAGQVLPRLHAIQHAQLFVRREAREMLEPLQQELLPGWRQTPECGIILQGTFLFVGRQVFVATQPVAGMPALEWGFFGWPGNLGARCWRRLRFRLSGVRVVLGTTGEGNYQCDRQSGAGQILRYVLSLSHGTLNARWYFRCDQFEPNVRFLRIRSYILLQIQIVQQLEIGIQVVILIQGLQVADCTAWRVHEVCLHVGLNDPMIAREE